MPKRRNRVCDHRANANSELLPEDREQRIRAKAAEVRYMLEGNLRRAATLKKQSGPGRKRIFGEWLPQ